MYKDLQISKQSDGKLAVHNVVKDRTPIVNEGSIPDSEQTFQTKVAQANANRNQLRFLGRQDSSQSMFSSSSSLTFIPATRTTGAVNGSRQLDIADVESNVDDTQSSTVEQPAMDPNGRRKFIQIVSGHRKIIAVCLIIFIAGAVLFLSTFAPDGKSDNGKYTNHNDKIT